MSRVHVEELIDEVWSQFNDVQSFPFVVTPSMPILFFGNYFQYLSSPLRIVTVGLNPSGIEFPKNEGPFFRFSEAVVTSKGRISHDDYLKSLSEYFVREPYRNWFSCYELILNGLDASYYGKNKNFAIHTDICTPIATAPTWSKLQRQEERITQELEKKGYLIWDKLISSLEPHIIILSVARRHLDKLKINQPWEPIYSIERKNPYVVERAWMKLSTGKKTMLIFGPARNKPFGTVRHEDKLKIGKEIKKVHIVTVASQS